MHEQIEEAGTDFYQWMFATRNAFVKLYKSLSTEEKVNRTQVDDNISGTGDSLWKRMVENGRMRTARHHASCGRRQLFVFVCAF